jgi:hypothetical protein
MKLTLSPEVKDFLYIEASSSAIKIPIYNADGTILDYHLKYRTLMAF